jgi:hypothetical protein
LDGIRIGIGRRRKEDTEKILSAYSASVYEDDLSKWLNNRGIRKERTIEGVNLIKLQYIYL